MSTQQHANIGSNHYYTFFCKKMTQCQPTGTKRKATQKIDKTRLDYINAENYSLSNDTVGVYIEGQNIFLYSVLSKKSYLKKTLDSIVGFYWSLSPLLNIYVIESVSYVWSTSPISQLPLNCSLVIHNESIAMDSTAMNANPLHHMPITILCKDDMPKVTISKLFCIGMANNNDFLVYVSSIPKTIFLKLFVNNTQFVRSLTSSPNIQVGKNEVLNFFNKKKRID